MKSIKIISVLFFALALTGCKVTVDTVVSLKELLHGKNAFISGDLYVEVASCNNYEDSRKPSSSVLKSQKIIPRVFSDSKYVECFSKNMNSYAHFQVPIAIDRKNDGKLASSRHLNIISSGKQLLFVGVPKSIKTNLDQIKKESFGMNSFDLNVQLTVKNDTGREIPFHVLSSYVDNQPHIYGKLVSKVNSSFNIRLSDVSVSKALNEQVAIVLLEQ